MMNNRHKATALVAILIVVLLGVFGIDRIGGETWLAAAASAQAGWRAGLGTSAPPSSGLLRTLFVPALLLLGAITVALLGAILKRFSAGEVGDAAPREKR